MRNTFNFYCDPGHGWLKVNIDETIELGIYYKISPFSFRDKSNLFLEEDCDAPLFINAYKNKFRKEPKLKFHQSNRLSKIRKLMSFTS